MDIIQLIAENGGLLALAIFVVWINNRQSEKNERDMTALQQLRIEDRDKYADRLSDVIKTQNEREKEAQRLMMEMARVLTLATSVLEAMQKREERREAYEEARRELLKSRVKGSVEQD